MRRVVTAEEMRDIESHLFDHLGMDETTIIENVGIRTFDYLVKTYSSAPTFFFFIGKGNNGADGVAAARHCFVSGQSVKVFLLYPDDECSAELLKQINLARAYCLPLVEGVDEAVLRSHIGRHGNSSLVLIDAILGIGYQPPLQDSLSKIFAYINSLDLAVVSIDMPSGVVASTGLVDEIAILASATLYVEYPKIGHFVFEGKKYCGSLVAIPAGFPANILPSEKSIQLLSYDSLYGDACKQNDHCHKFDFGHLLIVAGSLQFSGAAIMAAHAAQRTGVGLVTLKSWKDSIPLIASRLSPEIILGEISSFNDLQRYDCLLLGPGLGITEESKKLVQYLIEVFQGHLVLDADAITVLAEDQNLSVLKRSAAKSITLTPHMGEFARLQKIDSDLLQEAVIEYVQEFSREYGVTTILKDSTSFIASPEGNISVAHFPNSALATAGSGDILAGTLSGMLACNARTQRLETLQLGIQSVLVHSLAGDMARSTLGNQSVIATDLLKFYPEIFKKMIKA